MDRMWSSILWNRQSILTLLTHHRTLAPLEDRCLRCLLFVMCTHPFAKKALTLHLARSEGHERYFGCNLMHCKVLASSHQHLMAEAAENRVRAHIFLCMLSYYVLWHMMCIGSA